MRRARLGRWSLGTSGLALLLGLLSSPAAGSSSTSGSSPGQFVDQPVSFQADGMTVYGTYRHPTNAGGSFPAVLLIAGSGPTDRNGNSPEITGAVDTLETLADWLSADGVASLRYDKLGAGQTGLGPFAVDPGSIGIGVFEDESVAALGFLSHQPGVDDGRLGVLGHSEGALFALLLAVGKAGTAPHAHALMLLEPLSRRYLSLITEQVDAEITAQEHAGQLSSATAKQVQRTLATAVRLLRAVGTAPVNLPYGLGNVFAPATAKFLWQADRYDPARLGSELGRRFPVLVSCSSADRQVSCGDVDHLVSGLDTGHAAVDLVHLHGVDHVLKVDPSGSATNYGKNLPFSPQLQAALKRFVAADLAGPTK